MWAVGSSAVIGWCSALTDLRIYNLLITNEDNDIPGTRGFGGR